MNMTRQLKRAFALVSLALPLWAEAVTAFDAAESVWPAGLEAEMNTLIAFRAPFELKAGERPVPGGEIVYDWTVKGGRREETFAAPPGWRLIHCHAKSQVER